MKSASNNPEVTIRRILKVNHAGELGAIRIYQAQIFISKLFYSDVVAKLSEFLSHEKEHHAIFYQELRNRKWHPCYASFLWSLGGCLLGLLTGILGRSAIMVCTQAVEETVHRHLDDQLYFLKNHDVELYKTIEAIQIQENEHLEHARLNIINKNILSSCIDMAVCFSTETVIFLSTWGDSVRLRKEVSGKTTES